MITTKMVEDIMNLAMLIVGWMTMVKIGAIMLHVVLIWGKYGNSLISWWNAPVDYSRNL